MSVANSDDDREHRELVEFFSVVGPLDPVTRAVLGDSDAPLSFDGLDSILRASGTDKENHDG